VADADGRGLAIDDPGLIAELRRRLGEDIEVSLCLTTAAGPNAGDIRFRSRLWTGSRGNRTRIDKTPVPRQSLCEFRRLHALRREGSGAGVKIGDKAELMLLGMTALQDDSRSIPDTAQANPADPAQGRPRRMTAPPGSMRRF